jgi:hypothetical protein
MQVTLDVFSGRSNPTWTLPDEQARQLVERFAGRALPSAQAVESILGFRGFVIDSEGDDEAVRAGLPESFRIGGALSQAYTTPEGLALPTITQEDDDDAAQWLLNTIQGQASAEAVSDDVLSYVLGEIKARTQAQTAIEEEEQPSMADAPELEQSVQAACVLQNTPYNPAFWNNPQVQPRNNCYNYAMSYRSDTFAQPGRISGHPNAAMQCASVSSAASFDGCKPTCSGGNKLVALVVWPGVDYHWYGFHSNGFWGHKPGQTAARNTDNSGRVIRAPLNPQNCNRGPYTNFCGYRYSPTGMRVR